MGIFVVPQTRREARVFGSNLYGIRECHPRKSCPDTLLHISQQRLSIRIFSAHLTGNGAANIFHSSKILWFIHSSILLGQPPLPACRLPFQHQAHPRFRHPLARRLCQNRHSQGSLLYCTSQFPTAVLLYSIQTFILPMRSSTKVAQFSDFQPLSCPFHSESP